MEYIFLLYLALPCFIANMLPVIFNRLKLLPQLDVPLDYGTKLYHKRLFGDHKTVRGLLVGVLGAMLVSLVQYGLDKIDLVPFNVLAGLDQFLIFGFLSGLGALVGDALASAIKRQVNIPSGDPFIVFDQLDYIIGCLLLTSFIVNWSWHAVWFLLLFSLIVHPIMNILAFIFKIKKTYW